MVSERISSTHIIDSIRQKHETEPLREGLYFDAAKIMREYGETKGTDKVDEKKRRRFGLRQNGEEISYRATPDVEMELEERRVCVRMSAADRLKDGKLVGSSGLIVDIRFLPDQDLSGIRFGSTYQLLGIEWGRVSFLGGEATYDELILAKGLLSDYEKALSERESEFSTAPTQSA